MKIAIPDWGNRVSPVFDTATRLLIVEVDGRREISRFQTMLGEKDLLSRRCVQIQGQGVDILICGSISRPYLTMLMASGIQVISDIAGPTDQVLEAYLKDELFRTEFFMPGCKKTRFENIKG
jgi:predicted Fe-Mo cluster-binding NifX family protein